MKTLLLALCLFFCSAAAAQVDSNSVRHSLTLQVRDWYKIQAFIANKAEFERLYDTLKSRTRTANVVPTSQTTAKIDSISVRSLYGIANFIRQQPYSDAFWYFSRINNAIRAVADPFLQRRLDELDAIYQDTYEQTLFNEYLRVRNPL